MSLYPSLEDMKVDQAIRAQTQQHQDHAMALNMQQQEMAAAGVPPRAPSHPAASQGGPSPVASLYPSLDEYMGMNLQSDEVRQNLAVIPSQPYQVPAVVTQRPSQITGMVAPVSTQGIIGMQRAEVKQGIRMLILCKDGKGKMGLRIKSVSKGIFVAYVSKGSPAAMAGLRFGDQILQIDNETLAGYSTDKVHKILKKCNPQRVEFAVRDRPFERTITLQKDSSGHVGFVFKNAKITSLVKDSSAARNGLLTDHQLCEVNGQCVIGMKDKEIQEIMISGGLTVTVTIMPTFVYEHIIKSMGSGLLKGQDHSIPDI
ncbi:syntenin-1-like isoform X2 [Clavelina lepadiformis]|uniref:PDZ domain-containing protein n=1 Tax=Clavelina lepadiformis TaxID=159417 RepID=A0ABP0G349_CLALP